VRVTVKLFADLRRGRPPERSVEVEPGTTVGTLMRSLDIPARAVTIHFVNGRHAGPDTLLADGDTVALFPPVGGG
jgi:molybdopterin synthase sulfur carrier subunit